MTSLSHSSFISRRSKDRWGFEFCWLWREAPFWLFCITHCKFLWRINGNGGVDSITEDRISSENMEFGLSVIRYLNGSGEREGSSINQRFPNSAPRIPKCPRSVFRFCIYIYIYIYISVMLFWGLLKFLMKIIKSFLKKRGTSSIGEMFISFDRYDI